MANQFLALSLFLMLLAFFIVMNALSDFETVENKERHVLRSLALAFTGEDIPEDSAPSEEENLRDIVNEGDTLSQLEGLFDGHIANFQATRNRLGNVLHIQVPVSEFENAIDMPQIMNSGGSRSVSGGQGTFLQTMITVLRSAKSGVPYRMDMILLIPEDLESYRKNNTADYMEAIHKVGFFAQTLERSGMPKNMMSVGLDQGKSGYVDLFFYPYRPYSPEFKRDADDASEQEGTP